MAQISVKYKCGSRVACENVSGKVTAIFIRGKGRAYEFSYVDTSGNPTSCTVEETEIEPIVDRKLGF